MRISHQLEADMIAKGATVTPKPVHYPGDAPVEIETRMSWDEGEFSAEFQKLFKRLGWTGYHPWISIKSEPGFPDWTLARERIVFVELKKQKGKLGHEQKRWRDILKGAGQEWYCWKPADWEFIEATLA